MPRLRRLAAAVLSLAGLGLGHAAGAGEEPDLARWRPAFARPDAAPEPRANPTTPEKAALGRALFHDERLSGDGRTSCATCHQPELSFSDGVARRAGHDGEPLPRRTPPLWNLAWGLTFFWDGRAPTLEAQASGPIENPREMAGDLAAAAVRLRGDPGAIKAFEAAFPADPRISEAHVREALAAYQRTLVSPRTRFDDWVAGNEEALSAGERAGLALFVGKAGCVACHSGWRFTDEAFHDIGLPQATPDLGRGEALDLRPLDRAFKTPSLRERVWTAPYMHDGSVPTLEAAVDHYADGIVPRPTLSPDLPRGLTLSPEERAQLVAFLATLSSEDPPRPAPLPTAAATAGTEPIVAGATRIGQSGRRFAPGAVRIHAGETLTFVNDDTRTHQIRVDDPRMTYASGAQEPGDTLPLTFAEPGAFEVTCGVHPEMHLSVEVEAPPRH
ncbi:cytochrome c peroxidase [Salinarimonas soli]|uniref:C-type cytochrome n=1 Tax=Salinarimonas soli TaxID=1638099 RepID=A0A5B2VD69_9HYPH|nr:cytochrome c peroxidase [Salinarimonas soli]KAA2236626.1 c-type cytochrome [Salinarimonas soli]